MNWKVFLGAVVLSASLCTQSFAFNLFDRVLLGNGCGCEAVCGVEEATCGAKEPACGVEEATCGCESKCGRDRCCRTKYYKQVTRTRTKRVKDCCGCASKVCETKVSYRRVLNHCHHCPDDLVKACSKPCGSKTNTPGKCCNKCGCEPACGAAGDDDAVPAPPKPAAAA
ncbi:MAG: hypothetical protein VB875_14245 [Pirellulales bacterium]